MQNFPNSPVPLHPGFSRGGSVVSSSYQPHPSDLQISPRASEDYAAMQQAQPNLQSHGQHLHLRSQQHLIHTPPIHGYGSRRGTGEMAQGNTHSGGAGNSYRKESMDYFLPVSGRERSRRGGAGFGAGFRYTNIDSHAPLQYQQSSGMISPYPMDYSSSSGSGVGGSNSSSGAGSFSPSQQYSMAHNTSVQSAVQMHQRQHSQKYPSHQGMHQGQHHQAYPLAGNRILPQFGHYAPINAASSSSRMYNSPPQRYDVSNSSTDAKINNSPTQSNPNSHSSSNNFENMGQSYSNSTHPPYSPQSQSLNKHAPHSQRVSQHSIEAGYDPSLKVHHHLHTKMPHSPIPSSPALPPDIAKSPMHSQNQAAHIQQNLSPISNSSPAPSAVQSPSCSSSSSPLMGNSEGNSTATHMQPSSHPSVPNNHNSQRHGRLLQAVPQRSPTPNSNSSISSCGSSVGAKTASLNHSTGIGHGVVNQSRIGLGPRGGPGEDGSLYPHDKLLQDPGLNSLNALTSQVENLPNTVQHMLLTDNVLSQKKSRDGAHYLQMQQSVPGNQNKCGNLTTGNEVSSEIEETKVDPELEMKRIRQASGTSNESESHSYLSSHSQIQSELSQHGLDIKVNSGVISTASKKSTSESLTPFPQTKTPETLTPSSSSSPSVNPSAEPSPKQQLFSPPPPSPTHLAHLNCIAKRDLDNKDNNGMKVRKIKMIKDEESEVESGDPPCLGENRSENIFASTKEIQSAPPTKTEAETDGDGGNAQQLQNPSKNVNVLEQHNVGVIVSARSELHAESSKHTGAKSPRYGVSHYPNKHSCPEDQHDVKTLRAARNHNGEGEISMETYGSQYISPKQEFGQNLHLSHSNPSCTYSNPKLQYNACMSAKNKGKFETGSGMGPDRYQSYYQLQASYGSIARKDIGIFAVEGGRVIASRGQDSNSQFQQSFPSLLQEVLQGHHFDRRYGRPDQTSSVQQPQDTSQHRYQTRLSYSIIENLSSMGPQPVIGGLNVQLNQMASGKPPNSNKNQGLDNEMVLDPPHPTWDSEAQRPNLTQGISLEKSKSSTTPSQSTHMQQPSDLTIGAPPKHINLADYSLQHRKPSRYGTSPSAVEQLLLQETEPLACGVGPLSQTQSQTTSSSGRRSVICDVSPSRRTTPERERGHSGTSGPSVIQQPFSSSGSNEQEYCKGEIKAKKEHNEESTKINPAGKNADDYCSTPPRKEANKSLYPPVDVDSNLQRTSRAKGNNEPTSNLPYLSQISSNPLSSPTRHQSYSQAVDGFRAYGFSDSMDGPKIMSHPLTHRPLPTISPYSKSTPSSNKLQAFSPSLPPQNRPNWTPDRHRLKDMDRHVPQSLPDQKCKSQSPSDILPSQHHISRQHSYPGSHFDMKMWDVFPEKEGAGKPHTEVPHENFGSQPALNSATKHKEEDISDRSAEESAKPFHSVAPAGAISAAGHTGKATQGIQQGQRQAKTGVSAETNPLIMRRRVRSFISPIPAKRKHQDVSSQRPGSAYHSPLSHSDSRLASNSCSGSNDTQPKLASPKPHHPISSSSSLPQCKTKILPPRKGCGLKLEAIVQKITPSLKKANFNINSHGDSDYTEVSHYTTDIADPEGGTSFSNVPHVEEGCLSYLEDSHTLDNIMPLRTVKDTYACDSQSLKPAATTSSSSAIRGLPKDFDFGLGAAGSSGSLVGENDKDDFTLLGPLPPPPPLPCPVQESPPPSLSALSDIQQFTNTYQQLETRRSEQSAANLLRQKLLETGMGFDDYTDYYGADTGHSQSPGHHLFSQATQHQMTRLAGSESKSSENIVPKGYFPSGKKKGRPVGSVNKQKRAQAQNQNAAASIPATPLSSPIAAPQSEPTPNTEDEVPRTPTPPDQKPCTSLVPPAQTQVVKVDVESEEAQPEIDVKPAGHRQRKVKEGNETSGSIRRQRRKRRGMASKEQLDTQTDSRVNMGLCGIFSDARNNVFSPYIHVEKKIAEIGAVCTIINAEDEKSKGGGKSGHCGVDAPLNTLSSQVVRREKENERTKENWVSEKVDSVSQSGKTLPTSGHVLPGPVITETGHTGCLLCCLCQKWANYKNLGDLYGPFYPAEYVAKLPKNQPQIRQTMSHHGAATTGFIMTSISTELTPQDTRLQDPQNVKSSTDSDCTVSQATNPTSPATTIGTASPSVAEEMLLQNIKTSCSTLKVTVDSWNPAVELASELGASKELDGEIVLKQLQVEESQQRPQHRKLTSHPRFKRRHKSSEDLPRTIPINNKASLPFQPPPPSLDTLGPMAQLAQLPLVPLDAEELWVHEGCIVWTSGVYLVNGRLYGLQEALDGAKDTNCSHCEMVGSTLGCYSKGCTLRYHYLCAIEADCSLNEDNFSLRCPKHKSNRIAKPGTTYLEQSERGFSSRETTPDCVTFS